MKRNHGMVLGMMLVGIATAHSSVGFGRDGMTASGDGSALTKCDASKWNGATELSGVVTGNADGDTLRVRVGQTDYSVRMLSIDTPEKHYQGKSQGEWAERASRHLARILPVGTKVRLVFEEVRCDVYGRLLAHVFRGDQNVNLRMVQDGYAVNYCIFPNIVFCERYGQAARANLERGLNYYGSADFIEPYEWRRIVLGRAPNKFVGDLQSHRVYPPREMDRVEIESRVFFMNAREVTPPFKLVSSD